MVRLIVKYHFTIVFFLLEILCTFLIVKYNDYQKEVFSAYAYTLNSSLSAVASRVRDYFQLEEANTILARENAMLRNEIEKRHAWDSVVCMDSLRVDSSSIYNYSTARIVGATCNYTKNYLTIDKGERHGIRRDMAVCSPLGVVGIVQDMSRHYAIVQPLINTSSRVSAKIKKNNYYGSLQWDGRNYQYSYLKDIPFHVEVTRGDTVVTSGYSSIFPEGLLIGFVESVDSKTANFLTVKVRLAVDFKCLNQVYLIRNERQEEQQQLEKTIAHE